MVRVTVTRIEWDGTMQRRMVDTAQRGDGPQWEDLTGRALALLPLYRPVPRAPVYHLRAGDTVVQAAEQDLTGALLDLITAVLALGEDLLRVAILDPIYRGESMSARAALGSRRPAGALFPVLDANTTIGPADEPNGAGERKAP
jgi:hypothetical protein